MFRIFERKGPGYSPVQIRLRLELTTKDDEANLARGGAIFSILNCELALPLCTRLGLAAKLKWLSFFYQSKENEAEKNIVSMIRNTHPQVSAAKAIEIVRFVQREIELSNTEVEERIKRIAVIAPVVMARATAVENVQPVGTVGTAPIAELAAKWIRERAAWRRLLAQSNGPHFNIDRSALDPESLLEPLRSEVKRLLTEKEGLNLEPLVPRKHS